VIAESKSSPIDHTSDADGDERIAPPNGKSAGEIHAADEAADRAARDAESSQRGGWAEDRPQFSLRDLFVLTTIVAIELAGLRWFGARGLAAIAGMAAVGWLIFVTVYHATPLFRLVWWSLLVAYLLALLTALVEPALLGR
jgi:hypothetical protein